MQNSYDYTLSNMWHTRKFYFRNEFHLIAHALSAVFENLFC